ncbi:MAG TPA: hypothetical protein VN152_14530 [Sphingopyxis sp.]|nr:hypothetical protein [Sphingopyxis sp.]
MVEDIGGEGGDTALAGPKTSDKREPPRSFFRGTGKIAAFNWWRKLVVGMAGKEMVLAIEFHHLSSSVRTGTRAPSRPAQHLARDVSCSPGDRGYRSTNAGCLLRLQCSTLEWSIFRAGLI